jgi:hypothetical protein
MPTISGFVTNPENTMNRYSSASIGRFLKEVLRERYLNPNKPEEYHERQLGHYIRLFLSCTSINDPELTAAIDYIRQMINNPNNLDDPNNVLDLVTLFVDGKSEQIACPLKEVFALVCAATVDMKPYEEAFPGKGVDEHKKDREDRISLLCDTLKKLAYERRCRQGIRNDLVGTLNRVYPGAQFIEDINTFFLDTITSYFGEVLNKKTETERFSFVKDWIEGKESLKSFFEEHKQNVTQILRRACEQQFINPDDQDISRKIYEYSFCLDELPCPCIHENIDILQVVLEARFIRGLGNRNNALMRAKKMIKQCQALSDVDRYPLKSFVETEKLRRYLKNYRFAFFGERGWQIAQELREAIDRFYDQFPNSESISRDLIKSFEDEIRRLKADSANDFIMNFFSLYAGATNEEKGNLYRRFTHEEMQPKIILSDGMIQMVFSRAMEGSVINLSLYEINRVLLHTLLVSPIEWTEIFHQCFTQVLHFVKNHFNMVEGDVRERLDKVYRKYLSQFEFLDFLYRKNRGESSASPNFVIRILPNLTGVTTHFFDPIVHLIQFMRSESVGLIYPLNSHYGFSDFIKNFYSSLSSGDSISIRRQRSFEQAFTDQELKVLVHDRLDFDAIWNVLSVLSDERKRSFTETFSDQELKRVVSSCGKCQRIFNILSDARKKSFTKVFSNLELKGLVRDGQDYREIFKILPDERKKSFEQAFTDQEFLILGHGGKNYQAMFEVLSVKRRQPFMKAFNDRKFNGWVSWPEDYHEIFEVLPNERKQSFTETFTDGQLAQFIRGYSGFAHSDFMRIFSVLSDERKQSFVKAFFKGFACISALDIFNNLSSEEQQRSFIQSFSIEALRELITRRRGINVIQLLKCLSEQGRLKLIKSCTQEDLSMIIGNMPPYIGSLIMEIKLSSLVRRGGLWCYDEAAIQGVKALLQQLNDCIKHPDGCMSVERLIGKGKQPQI